MMSALAPKAESACTSRSNHQIEIFVVTVPYPYDLRCLRCAKSGLVRHCKTGAVDAAPDRFTKPWLLWSHHRGQIFQMTPVPGI